MRPGDAPGGDNNRTSRGRSHFERGPGQTPSGSCCQRGFGSGGWPPQAGLGAAGPSLRPPGALATLSSTLRALRVRLQVAFTLPGCRGWNFKGTGDSGLERQKGQPGGRARSE